MQLKMKSFYEETREGEKQSQVVCISQYMYFVAFLFFPRAFLLKSAAVGIAEAVYYIT